MLLNPDTRPPKGSIEALWRYAEADSTIGMLGPRLAHADGSFQRSCWRGIPGLGMALTDALSLWKIPRLPLARQIEFAHNQLMAPVEVDHLLGACLPIGRETWKRVGGLDENSFLFREETDLCYRAQQAGGRIVYNPQVTIIHLGQYSVNQDPQRNLQQFYRGYGQFYNKYHKGAPIQLALLKSTILIKALVRIGLWQVRIMRWPTTLTAYARAMQLGYWQVLRNMHSL